MELSTGILQSNHAHSVLLRDLISRQDAVLSRVDEQALVQDEIRSCINTLGGNSSSTVSTRLSSVSSQPSGNCNTSENTSIMSERSTTSFRLPRPDYIDDLKASRAYKRLRHFGLGIDSTSDSVLSFDSACSAGNWSMLSDITLGDLSISQIAVLNLPIELADVSNPMPFRDQFSIETPRSPLGKGSSRGRTHNAIENGNGFVVRALLAMGMDIEELDSNGRTPLIHATLKCEEATCKLLLEKGASVGALKAFTSGMDINERSELLDPLISKAMGEGSTTVTALRLLVLMALGANYGDDNPSSQSMMNVATDMNYKLAVRAIIHLEPQVLVEVDTEGRTPLVLATMKRQEAICRLLLEKGASLEALRAFTSGMDANERSKLFDPLINKAMYDGRRTVTALRLLVLMALGSNYGDNYQSCQSMMNVAIGMSYELAVRAIIHFEPRVLVGIDIGGRTPLIYAEAQVFRHSELTLLL